MFVCACARAYTTYQIYINTIDESFCHFIWSESIFCGRKQHSIQWDAWNIWNVYRIWNSTNDVFVRWMKLLLTISYLLAAAVPPRSVYSRRMVAQARFFLLRRNSCQPWMKVAHKRYPLNRIIGNINCKHEHSTPDTQSGLCTLALRFAWRCPKFRVYSFRVITDTYYI